MSKVDPAMTGPSCLHEIPDEERLFLTNDELEALHADVDVAAAFRVRTDIRTANTGPWNMSSPVGILLHHTAGEEAGDIATLTRSGTGVSCNYYITRQGVIYEFAPYPKRTWHAGESAWDNLSDWNTHGIGFEIENYGVNPARGFPQGQDWPKVQIDAIVWLARRLVKQFPAMKSRHALLARHLDVALPRGRKSDPNARAPHAFPYEEVRRRIFAATDPTDGGTVPEPDPEPGKRTPRPLYGYTGYARYSQAEVESWARTHGATQICLDLIAAIYKKCRQLRREDFSQARKILAPDAGCVQMCHETAFGRYTGASRPYNPAGIKLRSASGDTTADFERPANAEEGARMLVNHASAYTHGPTLGAPHGRYEVARQINASKAPLTSVDELTGRWATDPNYARSLRRYLDELEGKA